MSNSTSKEKNINPRRIVISSLLIGAIVFCGCAYWQTRSDREQKCPPISISQTTKDILSPGIALENATQTCDSQRRDIYVAASDFQRNFGKTDLVQFKNINGKDIQIEVTDDGEVVLSLSEKESREIVAYPKKDIKKIEIMFESEYHDPLGNSYPANNFLIIYSDQNVISQFKNENFMRSAKSFLDEFFSDTASPNRVLHLIFADPESQISFESVRGKEKSLVFDTKKKGDNLYMIEYTSRDLPVIPHADVFLSFSAIHDYANEHGIDVQQMLLQVLAAEKVNLEAKKVTDVIKNANLPKTESELIGYAAMFDPALAEKIFGGKDYLPFIEYLKRDMKNMDLLTK